MKEKSAVTALLKATPAKRGKYGAKPVTIDGIWFASTAEGKRYRILKLLESQGHISGLKLQEKFELLPAVTVRGKRIRAVHYIADFSYVESGIRVVEDVKGVETAVFRLKRNLFQRTFPLLEFRVFKV